jgi:hypothetical protein
MASEALIKYGTPQLLFADHATDFGAAPTTAANSLILGTPTDVQIDLTGLSASGGGRQSDKTGDLGATRPPLYKVDACIEFESAPTTGNTVDFYWGGSPSGTAGTGNPAALTGSDAAFTKTVGLLGELKYIGSLICRANVICIGHVGYLVPEHRYGILVIVNNAATAFRSTATAMDETHITFTPIVPEGQ